MNRQRQGGRDRRPNYRGGGDGLLGEGPGFGGGVYEPMVNTQVNQLLLMQQLLQQQAGLGRGGYGDGLSGSLGNMPYLQQSQGLGSSGGMGSRNVGMRNDRKRLGGSGRDDFKRRRHDSPGRGGDRDRSRGRDSNRSGESRDRKHSNRWESDRERGHGRGDEYNPAEPTDDDLHDREGTLFCHVCNKSMHDDESFRKHLSSPKHTQLMNSVLAVHQMKSNQLKFRMKAEEHLRKIESGRGGFNPDYFCKICNNSLTIPWERHRFSKIHTQRQLQVTRGCGWCKVHDFKNFTEVLEHRETAEHKKNAELLGKKKDEKERHRSRSRSRERRPEKHRRRSSSRDKAKKDKEKDQKEKKKEEKEEEDLTIPEYNAEKAVGLSYVVPVTGFFCKLCHKFYNNENSAKGAHCQSETHYEKFKLATEAKIAAREKRLADVTAEAEKKDKEESKEAKSTEDDEKNKSEDITGETKKEEHPEDDMDEEDYDDPLPLEDLDDDGGLAKDDDFGLLDEEDANITTDSGLNETNANSSFVFLSGEMAEAQVELNKLDQTEEQKNVSEKAGESGTDKLNDEVLNTSDDTKDLIEEDVDLSEAADEKLEDTSLITTEDEDEVLAAPTVSEPVKTPAKSRGGGTARRGRGRGRGKK